MAKVSLTEDASIMLRKYRWPGNIRQLKNIAEAVSALESSKIAPGSDKCIVDADVLSKYIPKEEPNLLPATVQQQDKFEAGEREAIIRTIFQLRQDVDYLKGIIEGAGLGMRPQVPVALPELPEEASEWTKPQSAYNVDPEDQDPEDQDPEDQILEEPQPEQLSMKKANLELVEKALQKHGGNRKAAAKELGISERTVYRKLDQIKKKK
jgi:transcriptional regulator with PAS, ATPase and Fis domain